MCFTRKKSLQKRYTKIRSVKVHPSPSDVLHKKEESPEKVSIETQTDSSRTRANF